jgi:hypothetical protein
MELPPEQLIRLLGLEGKPARRHHTPGPVEASVSAGQAERRETIASTTDSFSICALPEDGLPTSRKRPASAGVNAPRGRSRRTALLPSAIVTGVLAGLGLSLYLFWWAPPAARAPAAPAPETTGIPDTKAVLPPGKTTTRATSSAALTTSPPTERRLAPAVDDPQWRATVAAQEQRLRDAAETRFREGLKNTEPGIEDLRSAPPGQSVASVNSVTAPASSTTSDGAASNGIATIFELAPDAATEETGGLETAPGAERDTPPTDLTR